MEKKDKMLNKKRKMKEKPALSLEEDKIAQAKIKIESIKKYKAKKLKEWEENKGNELFDLKQFIIKEYDIHDDCHFKYLSIIYKKNNIKEFIGHYSKYQFVMKIETRKNFQKLFENNKAIIKVAIISYNIIPYTLISIKNIFKEVLSEIIKIDLSKEKNLIDKILINIFKNQHIYYDKYFEYLIPTRFSDIYEYKFNKLLFDIAYFFFPYKGILEAKNIRKEERDIMEEKLKLFKMISPLSNKFELIDNDDDLIDIFDFIFNCLAIMMQVKSIKRKLDIFSSIIKMCEPFDLENAKANLSKMIQDNIPDIYIDNYSISKYNYNNLNENSIVKFKTKNNKEMSAKAKEINWDSLSGRYSTDDFMLCFKYKTCHSKNYIMDEPIKEKFKNLFVKMIKSNILQNAMTQDSQAELFEYPFTLEDIIGECEESIHYVPFPASSIYGFTDKNSFNTYIYSNFQIDSLKCILTEYENILKTKCHEYKHITRIYFHIFNPDIELKTPKASIKSDLIGKNSDYVNKKIENIESSFNYRKIPYNKMNELDYGDIFELFWVGSRATAFFLANSYYILNEKTWEKDLVTFDTEFKNNIEAETVYITKNEATHPFLTSIIKYFKLDSNLYYQNEVTNKDAYKNIDENNNNFGELKNVYTFKETISHYDFPK